MGYLKMKRLMFLAVIFTALLLFARANDSEDWTLAQRAGAVKPAGQSFRCFRSFHTIDSFSAKAMHPKSNCIFSFLRVVSAGVDVSCTPEESGSSGGGCYARVWLNGETATPIDGDEARYTLELRALNDSVVRYKGMDGNGYSMCCSFINTSYSTCEWQSVKVNHHLRQDHHEQEAEKGGAARQELVPKYCVLHHRDEDVDDDDESGQPVPRPFSGEVTKPLHKLVPGAWEATITFSRKGEAYGRIVVPFNVHPADVAAAAPVSRSDGATAAEAAGMTDAAAVAVVAVDNGGDAAAAAV